VLTRLVRRSLSVSLFVAASCVRAQERTLSFSCAAFPRTLSESDLVARFGADNVTAGRVFGRDDGPVPGSIVFARRPDAKLEVAWRDTLGRREPAFVAVKPGATRWSITDSVGVGTDLRTLERVNGRSFTIVGFRAEMAGAVREWEGGRLEASAAGGCHLSVFLSPREGTDDPRVLAPVVGGTVRSSHPTMQELNPTVTLLFIWYSAPAG